MVEPQCSKVFKATNGDEGFVEALLYKLLNMSSLVNKYACSVMPVYPSLMKYVNIINTHAL